ncbi:MAG: ribonuclease H-like domain-containing protein [Chloroflexi bacterium]|nr:ribonuclease H-like domain-containing protein [Chloroflexota bacterium]
MPSISDRLKALGVKLGADQITPPLPMEKHTLEAVLGARPLDTPFGETCLIEERIPAGRLHGRSPLLSYPSLTGLAAWCGDASIASLPPQAFAFLDTETTGLSGGAGTYAFLIGVARFEGEELHLAQFFMRDPSEEPAQLAALEAFLAPCSALVTFNGKAFDAPLLVTRYLSYGWRPPFADLGHVDLLHLARRLWRDRLPSRTLGNLEVQILGAARTQEDVPGWIIPQMYFDFLRSGDARPLKGVIYHNATDVVSLAALLDHTAHLLAAPLQADLEHGVDLFALARLFEDLGDPAAAQALYLRGLEMESPEPALVDAVFRLAMLHKRQDNLALALPLWEQIARLRHLEAHIELAKYYEHRQRDYVSAIYWSESALALILQLPLSAYERFRLKEDLQHRLTRLKNKPA